MEDTYYNNMLILEVLTTAISYMLVPIAISIFYKYKITKKNLKLISALNSTIIYLVLFFLSVFFYVSDSLYYAVILGFVNYSISSKITENKIPKDDCEKVKTQEQKDADGKTKRKYIRITVFILFIVSLCANIYLLIKLQQITQIKSETLQNYEALQKDYSKLKSEYGTVRWDLQTTTRELESIEDEYNFYNSYAVVVSSVEGEKYHRYSCYHVRDFSKFYIFNYSAAKSKGYEPCSECNPPQ